MLKNYDSENLWGDQQTQVAMHAAMERIAASPQVQGLLRWQSGDQEPDLAQVKHMHDIN